MSIAPLPSASRTLKSSVLSAICTSKSSNNSSTLGSLIAFINISLVIWLSISNELRSNACAAASSTSTARSKHTGFRSRRLFHKLFLLRTHVCPVKIRMRSRSFSATRTLSCTKVNCFFCFADSITFSTNTAVIKLNIPNTMNKRNNVYGMVQAKPYRACICPMRGVPSGRSASLMQRRKTRNMELNTESNKIVPYLSPTVICSMPTVCLSKTPTA
mmetsp:Transcript_68402/g.172398  ORF Transcript_68402/g.172398 Transcript_68402/m.172398 type:complete len:216 (+) Transcript_68402:146-793(+)